LLFLFCLFFYSSPSPFILLPFSIHPPPPHTLLHPQYILLLSSSPSSTSPVYILYIFSIFSWLLEIWNIQNCYLSTLYVKLQFVPHREHTPCLSFIHGPSLYLSSEPYERNVGGLAKVHRLYMLQQKAHAGMVFIVKVMNTKCTVHWEVNMHHVGTTFYSSTLRSIPSLRPVYHSYPVTSYSPNWHNEVRWIQSVSYLLNCNPTKTVKGLSREWRKYLLVTNIVGMSHVSNTGRSLSLGRQY
jgi:hypothetical protein